MSEPDFAALGLLDGLADDDARAARHTLLAALHDDGVSVDELREAVAEGRLALVPAERALGGAPTHTPREVAEQAGVDLEAFEAIRRACGLPLPAPDARELSELDLAGARTLKEFIDGGMPLDGLVQASRVFGEAAAHAAAAAGTLANRTIPQAGDTEHDYAVRLAQAAAALTPHSSELLGLLYQLHTRANLRQEIVAAEEITAGRRSDVHEVSIGFCDLVGFTRLGEGVPAADLGEIATRLAALTADVTEPPVRLVKTIGDAVMLVAPEPGGLLLALLDVMDAAEAEGDGFPAVHAGVAHGPALRRWGDYYGASVNLAARLTERARPNSLITHAEVRERVGDDERLAWSEAGAKRLKGVSDPVATWRVRRPGRVR